MLRRHSAFGHRVGGILPPFGLQAKSFSGLLMHEQTVYAGQRMRCLPRSNSLAQSPQGFARHRQKNAHFSVGILVWRRRRDSNP